MTIVPAGGLVDTGGKLYTVTMASAAVMDLLYNAHDGIDGTTYQFSVIDSTAPRLVGYSPAQGAADVLKAADIVLTFNENVVAGNGRIVLESSGGNGADRTDTIQISDSQAHVTYNPAAPAPPLDPDPYPNPHTDPQPAR